MYKKILLIGDGSIYSHRAAMAAVALAKLSSARLYGIAVVDSSIIEDFREHPEIEQKRLKRDLTRSAERSINSLAALAKEDGLQLIPAVRVGHLNIEIINLANKEQIDLIVLGRHGRTSTAQTTYRSLPERILEDADCSVLIVA